MPSLLACLLSLAQSLLATCQSVEPFKSDLETTKSPFLVLYSFRRYCACAYPIRPAHAQIDIQFVIHVALIHSYVYVILACFLHSYDAQTTGRGIMYIYCRNSACAVSL